jgi:hypothetical protein
MIGPDGAGPAGREKTAPWKIEQTAELKDVTVRIWPETESHFDQVKSASFDQMVKSSKMLLQDLMHFVTILTTIYALPIADVFPNSQNYPTDLQMFKSIMPDTCGVDLQCIWKWTRSESEGGSDQEPWEFPLPYSTIIESIPQNSTRRSCIMFSDTLDVSTYFSYLKNREDSDSGPCSIVMIFRASLLKSTSSSRGNSSFLSQHLEIAHEPIPIRVENNATYFVPNTFSYRVNSCVFV